MKVKINKFPKLIESNMFSSYMLKKYGFDGWPENLSTWESILDKTEDFLNDLFIPLNNFIQNRGQKIEVQIDKQDTYSMDHTLAHIITPMLVQLKETKHGAPNVDYKDVPKELRPSKKWIKENENTGAVDPTFFNRWDWIMDEMIWAFSQKLTDWESQYYGTWVEDESKELGGYYKNSDWDKYKEHQARIENGFRLFGKYYENLWS